MTTSRSAKAKGRKFQKWVSEQIRNLLDLSPEHVQSAPASVTGEDIILSKTARSIFPFSVECKKQERLNIWAAIEQARSNTPAGDYEPIVVFSKNNEEVWVAIRFNLFTNMMKTFIDRNFYRGENTNA